MQSLVVTIPCFFVDNCLLILDGKTKTMDVLSTNGPRQEDHILIATSTLAVSKKWKKASDELKRRGFERSDIECRERYVNHLDPTVSKGSWSDAELDILYSKFNEYGNKWFLLQKHLPGRTQTKIKNYFYGNIRFLLKIVIKSVLNTKAGFINDIKTDTLLDIYQGKNDFDGIHLIEKTIKRLNYRVDRKNCEKLIKEHQEVFEIFAKEYLVPHSEGNNNPQEVKAEDGQSEPDLEEPEAEKSETMDKRLRVEVVSSVGGLVNEALSELEYLERMSKLHLEWHLHYKKAYKDLIGQEEEDFQKES